MVSVPTVEQYSDLTELQNYYTIELINDFFLKDTSYMTEIILLKYELKAKNESWSQIFWRVVAKKHHFTIDWICVFYSFCKITGMVDFMWV